MLSRLASIILGAILLWGGAAAAQCAGQGGIPFNCAVGSSPSLSDYFLAGSSTGAQSGQSVKYTLQQLQSLIISGAGFVTGVTAASPLASSGGIVPQISLTPGLIPLIANDLSEYTATAGVARGNLGLGSMATQAANNVAITGGSIENVALTIAGLPGLTANVEGTGVPGLDNPPYGWTIHQTLTGTSPWYSVEQGTLRVDRFAEYTGGNAGDVKNALWAYTVAGANVVNFEWSFLAQLDNYATGGQNAAVYCKATKFAGAGPTWCGTLAAIDPTNAANPSTGLLSLELDLQAGNTDTNHTRGGLMVVGMPNDTGLSPPSPSGAGITPEIYFGLSVTCVWAQTDACNFDHGLLFQGATFTDDLIGGTSAVATVNGIDWSQVSFSGDVLKFPHATLSAAGLLGLDLNSTALPAAQTGSMLQLANATGTQTRYEADAAAAAGYFSAVRYDGTLASPTTLQAGDEIGGFNGGGYDGAAVAFPKGSFRIFAQDAWTTSDNSTYADVYVTPPSSTTPISAMQVYGSGYAGQVNVPGYLFVSEQFNINGFEPYGMGNNAAVDVSCLGTHSCNAAINGFATPSALSGIGTPPDLGIVNDYKFAGGGAPMAYGSVSSYDATHAYFSPALATANVQAVQAALNACKTQTVQQDLCMIAGDPGNQYYGSVTAIDPGGASITVSAWYFNTGTAGAAPVTPTTSLAPNMTVNPEPVIWARFTRTNLAAYGVPYSITTHSVVHEADVFNNQVNWSGTGNQGDAEGVSMNCQGPFTCGHAYTALGTISGATWNDGLACRNLYEGCVVLYNQTFSGGNPLAMIEDQASSGLFLKLDPNAGSTVYQVDNSGDTTASGTYQSGNTTAGTSSGGALYLSAGGIGVVGASYFGGAMTFNGDAQFPVGTITAPAITFGGSTRGLFGNPTTAITSSGIGFDIGGADGEEFALQSLSGRVVAAGLSWANQATYFLGEGQGGTSGSPSASSTSAGLFILRGYGFDGTNYDIAGQLQIAVGGTVSSGIVSGSLLFSTATSAGTLTQALKIDATQAGYAGSSGQYELWDSSGKLYGQGLTLEAVAPTVSSGQVGYGSTIEAAGSGTCPSGTVGGQTVQGCTIINVAGTTRYQPFF